MRLGTVGQHVAAWQRTHRQDSLLTILYFTSFKQRLDVTICTDLPVPECTAIPIVIIWVYARIH